MSRGSISARAAAAPEENAAKQSSLISLSQATTLAEVQEALSALRTEHDTITARLDASLSQHEDLLRQLRRLDLSRARLGASANTTRQISRGMLSSAAQTASRISTAVERLDLEQARVNATLDVVEQVTELKACVLGVVGSMGAPQDWETAAEYLSRASRVPADVVRSGFAEAVVPTAEVPDPPSVTLDESAAALCQLFLREFEKAVEEGDGARITRFFKMFPLISRAKEGLEAYGRYVCQGVALRARARLQEARGVVMSQEAGRGTGFVYANALTKLFEHIAQVVDGHSGLVERHYGEGTMVSVLQRLHNEADVQGGIVLDTWYDERGVERLLTDVKSYAFSFLVQSFMPAQKSASGRDTRPQYTVNGMNAYSGEDQSVDAKEVDQMLSEIVAMLSSWSLYVVFVSTRALPPADPDVSSPPTSPPLTSPSFLQNSALPKKAQKVLIDPFKTLSTFHLRRALERALQLDEQPASLSLHLSHSLPGNPPYITSAVDDVMYVVSQLLQRALSTSSAEIVTSTCATTARVLGSDFIGMMQRRMRDETYPRPAVAGGLPPEDKVIGFIVLINNLDVAIDYIIRIVHGHLDVVDDQSQRKGANGRATRRSLADLFPMGKEAQAVRTALEGLETGFSTKARELLGDGITVLFGQVLKPRVRTLLGECFKEADYSANAGGATSSHADSDRDGMSDGFSDGDATESGAGGRKKSIKNRMQHGWDLLTRPLKRVLTAGAYDKLLSATVTFVAGSLERRIWAYHGKVGTLGAVALERDVVDVVNIVTRGERFGLREGFARCVEIVTVVNLEEEEWEGQMKEGEGEGGGEMGWVLSGEERERARALLG